MASSMVVGLLRVLLTANTAEFDTAMKRASGSAAKWSKDLKSMGRQASDAGAALTKAITVPLVGLGAVALKSASDFESSFAGIRKTVEDATDSLGNLTPVGAKLAQGMRDLAKEIPVNVNELNKIGEAAGQLGIKSENILGFTRVMADLGVSTNLSSDQAASSLARLANITGMPQTEFAKLGSTIVGLGNNFATTESEIVDFGLRIAGAGKIAGLTEHQILAIGTAMSSVGVQAEAGGTAVQKVLNGMTEAVATGNKDLVNFAKTAGMSAQDFAVAFRKDAAGAFQAFVEGLGQQGDQAFATLDKLGLGNERVIRAFLSLAGAGDLLSNSLKVGAKSWEENTALTKEAEQRYNTFENQLKLTWQQLQDVGITIGTALLPTFRDMLTALQPAIQILGDMAGWFAKLPEPVRMTAVAIAGVAAATGPAIWGFGQLALAASGLAAAFKGGAIGATAFKTSLAFLTSPVTLVGAAIAALAVTWANFKNDWVRAFDVLIPPIGLFRAGVESLQRALEPYMPLIRDLSSIISDSLVVAWFGAKQVMEGIRDSVLGPLKQKWDDLTAAVRAMVPWVRDHLPAAFTALWQVLNQLVPGFLVVLALENKLRDWAKSGKESVGGLALALKEAAGQARASAGEFGPLLSRPLVGTTAAFAGFTGAARQASAALGGFAPEAKSLSGELDATRVAVASLTAEQWEQIAAGDKLGLSTKDLTERINELFPGLRLTEQAVKLATDRLDENAKAADKAAAAQKKFLDSVRTGIAVLVPYKAAVEDAGAALQNLARGLEEDGTLRLGNAAATAAAREEAEQWAFANGAVLAPSIKAVGSAADDATTATMRFGESIRKAFDDLPTLILGVLQGGGDLGKSIGALFGGAVFGKDSALVGSLTKGLSSILGKTLGGALGSVIPGLGTLLGAQLGSLASKLFGKLFGGGEHRKVNDLRDAFTNAAGGIAALDAKANAAGLTLDRFLKAKTVKDYEAAILELNTAFGVLEQNRTAAAGLFDEIVAMGSEGIPASFRPAIEQLIGLGLLTDEQADKLRAMGDASVVNVDKMRAAMEVLGGRIESLGPAFRQADIDKTAGKYINAIETLIRGGGDVGGVLFDAREEIGKLVADSLKFGTTLPANMKPWIDELLRSGNLLDENGNKIDDISGLQYGEAMKTEAEIAEEGWNKILAAIERLIASITGPLEDALDNVTRDRTIRIRTDYQDGGTLPRGEGDNRGFALGTMGRLGKYFAKFPESGFQTMLHGFEAVLRPQDAVPFAVDVLSAVSPSSLAPAVPTLLPDFGFREFVGRLEGGSSSSTETTSNTTNVVMVAIPVDAANDPYRIANEVFRQWPDAAATDRHGVRTAIEHLIEDYRRTYG